MNPDFDDYEDIARDENTARRSRSLPRLILSLAILGFLGLAFYAYQSGTQSVQTVQVPYVEAEAGAIKEVPADVQGEQFAHKDKTIYDAISPYTPESKKKVEKLLPEPEEPVMPAASSEAEDTSSSFVKSDADTVSADAEKKMTEVKTQVTKAIEAPIAAKPEVKPTIIAPEKTSDVKPAEKAITQTPNLAASERLEEKPVAKPIEAVETTPVIVTEKSATVAPQAPVVNAEPKPAPVVAAEKSAAVAPQAIATPAPAVIAVAPKPDPVTAPPAPAPTPVVAPSVSLGVFKVQLGAFQSEAEAKQIWQKISAKHSDVLGGKSYAIVRAELPNGTYYRLRASGFDTADAAKAACTTLSSRTQGCFFAGR